TLAETARQAENLDLLLLFGSRARDDSHAHSDWDLGYLARPGFDVDGLLARAVLLLGSDRVDLVDLKRASGLLRFRAAAEGKVLYESTPDSFADFWFEAVSFWCDAEPILKAGYEAILDRLPS
ncbi:MAG TPA: nucleotidyltransferase domain-containing protein, partial [Thermoanaerobaculia bacterium]|nr:nucleotidyltransferase domain-containing protein [Thermoanaerobaculia bacterium]